jgi:hypothetical protein
MHVCEFAEIQSILVFQDMQVFTQPQESQGSFLEVSIINGFEIGDILRKGKFSELVKRATVYVNHAGFREVQDTLMKITAGDQLVFKGAPGIGKSTACWSVLCQKRDTQIVYVRYNQSEFIGLVIVKDSVIVQGAYSEQHKVHIGDLLRHLRDTYPQALIIVDGLRHEDLRNVSLPSVGWVFVSSTSLQIKDNALAQPPNVKRIDSWLESEYELAMKKSEIISPKVLKADMELMGLKADGVDNLKQWLKEKYFLCGGSARFMFCREYEKARDSINNALKSTRDLKLLLEDIEGPESSSSVSSLRQSFGDDYFPLSEYVVKKLLSHDELNTQFVVKAKTLARSSRNKAILGWMHELMMLLRIRSTLPSNIHGYQSHALNFTLHSRSEQKHMDLQICSEESFFKLSEVKTKLGPETVFLCPIMFNQGCFDAVVMNHPIAKNDSVFITLQATVAPDHSFKPHFITLLLQQVVGTEAIAQLAKSMKLWHIFVVESESQLNGFKLPDVEDVGIRSSDKDRAWAITPVFWKAVLA